MTDDTSMDADLQAGSFMTLYDTRMRELEEVLVNRQKSERESKQNIDSAIVEINRSLNDLAKLIETFDKTIDQLETEVNGNKELIKANQLRIDSLTSQNQQSQAQIASLESTNTALQEKNKNLEIQINEATTKMNEAFDKFKIIASEQPLQAYAQQVQGVKDGVEKVLKGVRKRKREDEEHATEEDNKSMHVVDNVKEANVKNLMDVVGPEAANNVVGPEAANDENEVANVVVAQKKQNEVEDQPSEDADVEIEAENNVVGLRTTNVEENID